MPAEDRKREWIVIADADVIERHAIAEYLRHCGYRVVEAATSDEVVTLVRDGDLDLSTVLCDAELPGGMNGFELRLWMRQHSPQTEVALVGSAEAKVEAAGDLCEAGPHLRKPYSPEFVLAYLRRMSAGRRSRGIDVG